MKNNYDIIQERLYIKINKVEKLITSIIER